MLAGVGGGVGQYTMPHARCPRRVQPSFGLRHIVTCSAVVQRIEAQDALESDLAEVGGLPMLMGEAQAGPCFLPPYLRLGTADRGMLLSTCLWKMGGQSG